MRISFRLGIVTLITLSPAAVPLVADDFRVETEIYQGRQKVSQTLTLFSGDLVYDYLQIDSEGETTVFDQRRQRFILLNEKHQIKTEITTDQVMQVMTSWMESPVFRREATEFESEYDESQRRVIVQGKLLTYEADGTAPKHSDAILRYQQFADWYARLNATRQGNPPPFARIKLNAQLAQKGLIPSEVRRIAQGRRQPIRSKHSTLWMLSNSDRQRIRRTGDQIAQFRFVPAAEYWKSEQVAAKAEK